MNYLKQVFATNQINMKNSVITDDALEEGAKQINSQGGIPYLHSHDWKRLMGWTTHAWTEREGNFLQLVGEIQIPETAKELEEVSNKFQTYCERIYTKETEPFIEYLGRKENCQYKLVHDVSCVYINGRGIVLRKFPELRKRIDEDGLLFLKKFDLIGDGLIRNDKYLLAPHRCFRESYSLPNMLNRDFLGSLVQTYHSHPELEIRLKLDGELIGIPESLVNSEQLDYWWGPKYKSNPCKTDKGVCVHGATKHDRIFGRFRQTEFWWYGKQLLTFEIEEVLEEPLWFKVGEARKIGMRFIHSIFNPETKRPCHLDGAVRLYDKELFDRRKSKTIDKFGKSPERLKLWRVDGDIPTQEWFNLIHTFFRNNFMVGEYFGVGYEESG